MADVKISGLPASTVPLAGTEVLPIVQGGQTRQVSVNNLTAGKNIEGLGLNLTSTDAGASQAPTIDLYRDSASPAASDTIGELEFNGKDSAGNKQQYAVIHASILSPTSTTEQGQIHFETATAGASTEKMIIGTTNLVINEIGAIFNVRIEGDTDANLFYTDATNSRVGIGTISPSTKLDVNGSFNVAGAATISPANAAVAISPTGTGTVAISPAGALTVNPTAASTMNNVAIGGTTALAGRFTDLSFNSGYGSVATVFGCRAWCNFNATGTPAIRSSGNCSSISSLGTGYWGVNLTNAMPDVNYSAVVSAGYNQGVTTTSYTILDQFGNQTTSSVKFYTQNIGGVGYAPDLACISVFR